MSNTEDKMNEIESRISNIEKLLIKNSCNDKIEQPSESNEINKLKSIIKLLAQTFVSGDKDDLVNRINNACENKNNPYNCKWTIRDINNGGAACCYHCYSTHDLCNSCNAYSELLSFVSDY